MLSDRQTKYNLKRKNANFFIQKSKTTVGTGCSSDFLDEKFTLT